MNDHWALFCKTGPQNKQEKMHFAELLATFSPLSFHFIFSIVFWTKTL